MGNDGIDDRRNGLAGMVSLWLLCLGAPIAAQAGSLQGVVIDGISGRPLRAGVQVMGIGRHTIADSVGSFTIDHLEEGEYSVQVSALGYYEKHMSVSIEVGGEGSITIQMVPLFRFEKVETASPRTVVPPCGAPKPKEIARWEEALRPPPSLRSELAGVGVSLAPLQSTALCTMLELVGYRYLVEIGLAALLDEVGAPSITATPMFDMVLGGPKALLRLRRERDYAVPPSAGWTDIDIILVVDLATMTVSGFFSM
jgi:hypothetical protein